MTISFSGNILHHAASEQAGK